MKIGLVFDDSLDKPDGVQQYVLTLGTWLAAQGHQVHYIVGETHRTDLANLHSMTRNIGVRFNGNRMAMPRPTSRAKIRALLREHHFDVLHVQVPYSPFLAARVIAAAAPSTAVIGTFHIVPNGGFVRFANRLLAWWLRPTLRRFDQVLAVSAAAQRFAAETYGLDAHVMPNTINLRPFFAATAFSEYQNYKTIVFLGRLVERKGCQHLLTAVHELTQTYKKPCKVVICGDGPLRADLTRYVASHGLGEIVVFKGHISEADKPRFLASADIVTYPSTGGESFGIVLLEAMAAARGPVLAGDNPGYASVLAERTEALFRPKDTATFATLLKHYLDDKNARAEARNWQQTFVAKYDIEVVGKKIVETYRQALHQRQNVQ